MNRRHFLRATTGAVLGTAAARAAPMPIIDTHIHLFDPTRPQGVPWPEKTNPVLYRPALPRRYRKIAVPLGVVGAIEVEASPWLEDNQWVLDVAAKDKIVVGTVGDLEPAHKDFLRHLERFHKNPLFLGIRLGNLWNRDLGADLAKPAFVPGVKALAAAGLVVDIANPTPTLLADVVRLTDKVPNLRVVIDHLPQMERSAEPPARNDYLGALGELGKRPQVYAKVSEVLRRVNGRVPGDLSFYRARIDEMWEIFGEDRLIYGSDWPNSDTWGPYEEELRIVREYFSAKGAAAAEKYFWKNSIAAYRWVKRDPSQPRTAA